jgi:hypothetical protein
MAARWRIGMGVALTIATATTAASAQTQPWLQDRRYTQGIGIRTGNLELHPSIAAEIGYDSNYFQRAGSTRSDEIDERVIDVFRLRMTPSIWLSTLSAQRRELDSPGARRPRLSFRGHVAAAYNELVALDGRSSHQAAEQRNLEAGAGFELDVLPHDPLGTESYFDFVRTVQPSNDPEYRLAWNRDLIDLGTWVRWRTGDYRLELRLGYDFRYTYFEADAYHELNNAAHTLRTKGKWECYPRTALLYDAEVGMRRFTGGTLYLASSSPVRVRVGVTGLVAGHYTGLALIGWGANFYTDRRNLELDDYHRLIAQAEARWFPRPLTAPPDAPLAGVPVAPGLSSVAAGYVRDFQYSSLTDSYGYDRIYLKADHSIGGALLVSSEIGWARYSYPQSYFLNPDQTRRSDAFAQNRLTAQAFAEYRLSDRVGVNSTLTYAVNLEHERIPSAVVTPGAPTGRIYDDLAFRRFIWFVGARYSM